MSALQPLRSVAECFCCSTCTFQPRINNSAAANKAEARYMQSPSKHKTGRHQHAPTGLTECTFNPQTNEVSTASIHMSICLMLCRCRGI